ncbi:peptidase C14, caspase domain-containing protein [Armillaria nabsnona]|nr:peptidase C14, caspase domain-containing protein [Armillaria nabsnona]
MTSFVTDKIPPAPHGKVDGQKFWAVVIGINGYKTSPLRGCVSDAEMVTRYLINDLHVPENHIQLLLSTDTKEYTVPGNNQPTRANIVKAILGLSTNTEIQRGDNIIIYFAGHGTAYKCAEYPQYENDGIAAALGNVDALCPIDRGPEPTTSAKTPDTNVDDVNSSITSDPQVPDICDREINTILTEIARTKGDHITFIVDCCHSSSIGRAPQEGLRLIAPLPSSSIPDMFSAADETLKHIAGYQSISEARWRANMDSHVILAACKEYEHAREVEVEGDSKFNGVFTKALISALKSADLNDKSMTYYDLIATLPKNDTQHPVIAGKHMKSRLWFQDCDNNNTKASSD